MDETTTPTVRLLDEVSAALGGITDYRIAKLLGITTQRVSQWRVGKSGMGATRAIDLCELAWPGDETKKLRWLIELEREREKDERARELWARLARQVAAVLVAIGLTGGALVPGQARAMTPSDIFLNAQNIDYAQSRRRRRRGPARTGTGNGLHFSHAAAPRSVNAV